MVEGVATLVVPEGEVTAMAKVPGGVTAMGEVPGWVATLVAPVGERSQPWQKFREWLQPW